ncbi:hypothetical protein THRCLA_23199 [Thraustotheca clavata]|uniref:Crinkler (CRN) family protein n=1 Tax=Thraustotheca clavata TaxID=74557 RepID=A0A1V9YAK1_9STRA|nr:hypothetical protein THRCLA_23199 [Thraustotheca clavata]
MRKWFDLYEVVDMLRDAVFAKVLRVLDANVIAPHLVVFANKAAFNAKCELKANSLINLFNNSMEEALVVQVSRRVNNQPRYFITKDIREHVRKAVFYITANKANTISVFFTPMLAMAL